VVLVIYGFAAKNVTTAKPMVQKATSLVARSARSANDLISLDRRAMLLPNASRPRVRLSE
jgi:hypothetical protein